MRNALVALVVLLVACGDTPRSIDDPARYLVELRAAECAHLVACGVFADPAQCVARLDDPGLPPSIWSRPPGRSAWLYRVDDGAMTYAPERAGACIAALEDGLCSPGEQLTDCWQVFAGAMPAGATVGSPDECISGEWVPQPCDEACCPGVCTVPRNVVSPPVCSEDGDGVVGCPPHLACRDVVCVQLADGDTCFADDECPPGLVCDGRCRPRDEIGERCSARDGHDSCGHVAASCGPDGVCRALGAEGARCDDSAPCRGDLHCDPARGSCVAIRSEGERCGDAIPCAAGLYCRATDDGERCVPQDRAGARCDRDEQCDSGTCAMVDDQQRCVAGARCD